MVRCKGARIPWTSSAIQMRPVGLRECVARIDWLPTYEVRRLSNGTRSLQREVARWRLYQTGEWQVLTDLIHQREPCLVTEKGVKRL